MYKRQNLTTDAHLAAIAIEHKTGGKGRMVINYSNLDQLDGILRYFRPEPG